MERATATDTWNDCAFVWGLCESPFAEVEDSFRRNLEWGDDLGASVAVYVDGVPVVDLWGGWAHIGRGRPWERDTLAVTLTASRGPVALCAHVLAAGGELDFDAPVARYWPEFAAGGKASVLVSHVLANQAGLPVLRDPPPPDAIHDWAQIVARLERQEPLWPPGTDCGDHSLTFGYLVGELVRRITGRTIGQFFATEIAAPLGLDLWMGMPLAEQRRVSALRPAPELGEPVRPWLSHGLREPDSLQRLVIDNMRGQHVPRVWNSPAALAAERPSTGAVGHARSLALMYSALTQPSRIGGVGLGEAHLERAATVVAATEHDRVTLAPSSWTLGFASGLSPDGSRAFGHTGCGAAVGFADPDARLAFGYVSNTAGIERPARALIDATYRSVAGIQRNR